MAFMKIVEDKREWFRKVFEENYEYILNYLFYLSGDTKVSEDLAQDVFLQLWESRESVRNETIRPFLFTIARNDFLKSTRRAKYDLRFKSGWFETLDNESPEFITEMKEFDDRLQKAIASLPEKCRVVYLMSRMDDLTYNDIASNLGVSVKAVEKQMSKALSLLRSEFGEIERLKV